MKTLLLALLLTHTGCATIASETQRPADPSRAPGDGPIGYELPRQPASIGTVKEAEPAFAVVGGHLMMNDQGVSSQPKSLWPIAEAPLLWTRFVSYGGSGYAVVLRQHDAILVGTLDPDRNPLAELARIQARQVMGLPAVAASGEVAIVMWAQGESSGCTSLVGALVAPGERPGPVHHMAGTECTVERSARAPKLSRTAEGGFLLAFTEIGVWSSQPAPMSFDAPHQGLGGGDVLSPLTPLPNTLRPLLPWSPPVHP